MSDTVETQVYQTASDVLGVPVASLNAASSPATIEGWDSVQHLNLLLAIEPIFNMQFEPEEIEQMKTLGDVVRVVKQKSK